MMFFTAVGVAVVVSINMVVIAWILQKVLYARGMLSLSIQAGDWSGIGTFKAIRVCTWFFLKELRYAFSDIGCSASEVRLFSKRLNVEFRAARPFWLVKRHRVLNKDRSEDVVDKVVGEMISPAKD